MDDALETTEVLLIDCQTTGASPARGRLLELAWARTTAAAVATSSDLVATVRPMSRLVSLPEGETLSRRITALTGIDKAAMSAAVPAKTVWQDLSAVVDVMREAPSSADEVPTVIHFARFEEPFLRELHAAQAGEGARFPFELICTHAMALALLPTLPRKGLRALAGYLGYVMGERKRAGDHVIATAVVWSELVSRAAEAGVRDLGGLRAWLAETAAIARPPRKGPRSFPLDRRLRLSLPAEPGVYRMLARGGRVLYVGKATSLQRRVNSYFQKRRHDRGERTLELLTQVRDVDVTVTASPLEAALLESDEIKRLAPPYNKALRDDGAAWFATIDGADAAPGVDDAHPLGPLPDARSLDGLGTIAAHVASGGRPPRSVADSRIFGFASRDQLDADCLAAGLRLFCERNGLRIARASSFAPLIRLDAAFWRRDVLAVADGPDADSPDAGDERPWDPDRVAAALEGVVRTEARLLRRAHLLCQLTESCVAYRAAGAAPRLLVIEGGAVREAVDVEEHRRLPAPPGRGRRWSERQALFDGATYDRLRVLVTELKRLVSEGATVAVSLGSMAPLGQSALARRLRWV